MPQRATDPHGDTPLVILGMHRSGTSCLAGSLQQRGLHLGTVHEASPHNRRGNRENQRVMELNNAVLAASGGSWDEPPAALRWEPGHAAERDAIIAMLAAGSGGRPWGFKDPRTLLTLSFWREALPRVRLVGTFRHPMHVVRSLHARGHTMETPDAIALWAAYNRRLLALHAQSPFPIVCFDATPERYRAAIDALAVALGLGSPPGGDDLFFSPGLRHHDDDPGDALAPGDLALLGQLLEVAARWAP